MDQSYEQKRRKIVLLSISEELFEGIGKPLGVLDEFALFLVQRLFAGCPWDVG